MPPTRTYEREIQDLEDHMATLDRYLDVLAAAARNARSLRDQRWIAGEIAYTERIFSALRARRGAIRARLNGTET